MFRNLKRTPRKQYRGRSASDPDFDDTRFYNCRVCGWSNNALKVRRRTILNKRTAGEWKSGIRYRSSDESANYVNVTSGCAFCGSFDSK